MIRCRKDRGRIRDLFNNKATVVSPVVLLVLFACVVKTEFRKYKQGSCWVERFRPRDLDIFHE